MRVRYAATALLAAAAIVFSFTFYSGFIAAVFFFPFHAAILLFAAVNLWFALYRRFGCAGPWAVSLLSAPVIVVAAVPAIGVARPYVKLAENYARYTSEVRAQEGLGPRYASWDWTDDGGFAPPQVWLVYDETRQAGGQKTDEGLHGPGGPKTVCPGRSRHLLGHFYICSTND